MWTEGRAGQQVACTINGAPVAVLDVIQWGGIGEGSDLGCTATKLVHVKRVRHEILNDARLPAVGGLGHVRGDDRRPIRGTLTRLPACTSTASRHGWPIRQDTPIHKYSRPSVHAAGAMKLSRPMSFQARVDAGAGPGFSETTSYVYGPSRPGVSAVGGTSAVLGLDPS